MAKDGRQRRPDLWHFTFFFLLLFLAIGTLEAANPWVQPFNPIRTLYVSPNGNGDGSQGNPMSLSTAMNTAQPGDLYWLTPGTYSGQKTFTRDGTASNPIVWRGQSGAIIAGGMELTAAHNWAWGLEVSDPTGNGNKEGITLYGTGTHAINNIVHDIKGRCGIGAWSTGSGQVIYGNIVYKQIPVNNNPHNIYTQNDYATYGYKYFVQNMVLDSWDATQSTYNFHAYTQGSSISGFHVEKNIFRRGKFLIGGTNLPADNEIVKENYYYDSPVLFGWNIPAQVKFTNNYMGLGWLDTKFFWGAGEQVYVIPDQSVYTGNSIMKPSGQHVQFRTAAYMPNWCVGCPKIRSGDTFDNNTYSSPFAATFWADNFDDGVVDWNTWKTDTLNAGNAFDTNSTVITTIPDKTVLLANEYEAQRGELAIYNWSLSSTVTVDLSSILPNGTDFVVLDPRNMGTPVYQGTYNAPVNIPTSGKEFLALLVAGSGSAPPPPPDTTPPDTTITSSFCGTTVTSSTVTVTWTGSDDTTPTGNLVYAYKLDSGNYSSYDPATSHTFNNLSNGSHTVSVKAKDQAGNEDPSPASCTFTVNVTDTTPPDTTITSTFCGTTVTSSTVTVTWTGSDDTTPTGNLVYAYKLDSGNYSSYTSATSNTFNNLSNGSHTVSVKAKDEAGNVDPSPATCTFTVNVADTTAPVLSNVTSSNVTMTDATITWNTDENSDSQVEYSTSPCPCGNDTPLDTNMVTSHTRTISGLTAGTTYHYRAKSRDASGNIGYSNDQTFTTLPPPPPPPPPPGQVVYYVEPEDESLVAPMTDKGNDDASNHKYVESTVNEEGTVTFTLDVPEGGTYFFWARVKAIDGFHDSFYVSADGGSEDIFDCAAGNQSPDFQWSRVNGRSSGDPRMFNFSAGNHTLKFRGREAGTSLDMLVVTDKAGFVPPAGSAITELYKVLAKKVQSTSAKIKWRSTSAMNSFVEYGASVSYGNTSTLDSTMVVKHKVSLENLQPNTTYHFRVTSVDANSNKWVSADFTFTTLP